jgi:prolyl oligopeptidase
VARTHLSWTKSPLWYALDSKLGKLTDTALVPTSPVDYSQIEAEEVQAKSADGTMVPLSIIHKRGLALDGSHPTWLGGVWIIWDHSGSDFPRHPAGVP